MDPRVPAACGRLLASGRACDVFEYGTGAVLRRYREGGDPGREAEIMRRAAAAGVPVPRVLEVLPVGLVLERIEGPTMLADIERRPWRFRRHGRALGRLHGRILDADLVHGDMHPLNIILGSRGPVVIDWTNAGEGDPEFDVAYSQVVLSTSETDFDPVVGLIARSFQRRFVRAYLRGVGVSPSRESVARAIEHRLKDRHVRPGERESLLRLQPRTK